jgi:CHAT domain-containing protein
MALSNQRGETIEAARAQHILAIIYLFIGRFNEALELSDRVLTTFLADQRHYDAIVVQLLTTDCLLQLGRFADVLEECRRVRPLFTQLGTRREVAKTVLNEAIAFAGLRHYEQAMASFAEAYELFLAEGNRVWAAIADLEKAAVQSLQGSHAESFQSAKQSIPIFATQGLQIRLAQAQLIAARAAFYLGDHETARTLTNAAQAIAQDRDVPWLRYQSHYLQADLAQTSQNPALALTHYEQGIQQLERLRGRLMVEFQADFIEDRQGIYEAALRLCLALNQVEQAFHYAERAKSRSLVNLIADRLDVRLHPRSPEDEPIVAELQQLCDRRNQLVRQVTTASNPTFPTESITTLEEKATRLWHKLLIHNADYARDAALMEVRTEEIRPYLDAETLLIEYFIAQGELLVFLVTRDGIEVRPLPNVLHQLRQPARLLNLALKAVPTAPDAQIASLMANAQTHLHRLHQLLLESVADIAVHYAKWLIVPHGPLLHYLPFHALHDGQSYLIERHEISYLPAASLLRYIRQNQATGVGVAAFGHSQNGRLPFALQEANTVAHLLGGDVYLEEQATLTQLQTVASHVRLLHLATHGSFNKDNPLFSGLALADGALNTLDVFNLRLGASLVTLSACQTGRSVIKGGDELQGLLRAFLYAGSQSLLLGLWRVADQSTLHFMELFYYSLAQGMTKGEALRHAQCLFLGGDGPEARFAHPYYWAPFLLVGDNGRL